MTNNSPDRPESPATADPATDERDVPGGGASFPIVGVGASAGGLEAFTELLNHLPLDTGMGFVLVQHLDPQHESALTQLLTRATALPVGEVTNNLRVEPNRVYIIPPNTNLGIEQGVLKLQPRPQTRTPHRSIDFFLESLAQDQRERAIGVILSGTATDGTLGLEAIKAEGGITFAQDESARYDSMPRSAAAAGCVDFVLSPENIAKELARIAKHPYVAGQPPDLGSPEDDRASATAHVDDAKPLPSGGRGRPGTGAKQARAEAKAAHGKAGDNGYKKILLLLRNHSGVDFSLYKSSTIQRRVTRRMVLNRHHALDDYASFLKGNAKELDALYSDVLISVTSFFRNPEAFEVLKTKVFPRLLQRRGDEPFRVWTLGCSTGQEAYSIAMAFVESAEQAPRSARLQVFATDLNDALLDKARHGLYAKSLAADVSPERLRRFFVEEDGGYRIIKPLREMVVFARQNLISDPPFSRMDLISCRNLLIYLEPDLQKKALPTFHYALKPEGFLFLGASESIGSFTDLFEPADKKHKIYSRKTAPTPAFHLPVKKARGGEPSPGQRPPSPLSMEQGEALEGFRAELNAQREADRVTVNQFAPPGVLVNAELQILQFRGPTGAYLEPPSGKASFDVLKMAREGLMLPLRAAINKTKKENKTARKENVKVGRNGATRLVNVEVIPLKNLRERCFLILFEDAQQAARAVPGAPSRGEPGGAVRKPRPIGKKDESRRIAELETDLSETRDYLQSIQEQHEAANEELQAANEEVQSANEELQSINEELETSKEELESANEELTTVNEEMANRNTELNRLNSDLANLQTSTQLAIVLLGRDLTIRRFSAQAEKQFDLLAADIGRPIGNVRHDLVFPEAGGTGAPRDLESFIAEVVASVREREREVRDNEGRWYSLRVRPYMTLDNKVDGAVLVLIDIDALKRSEQAIAAARDYAEAIVRTTRDPLLILNADLRVHTANAAFYHTFKVGAAETEGRSIYDLGNGQWKIPRLRQLLDDILSRNSFFNDFEVAHDFEAIGRRTMLLNARALKGIGEVQPARILLGIEDVTEVLQFQTAERESAEKFKLLFERSPLPKWAFELKTLRFVDVNEAAVEHYGYSREEFLRMSVLDVHTTEAGAALQAALARPPHRPPERDTCQHRKKSGEVIDVEVRGSEITLAGKRVWLASIDDISERKRAEDAVREIAERLRRNAETFSRLVDEAPFGIYVVDSQFRLYQVNAGAQPVFGNVRPLIGRDFAEAIRIIWPEPLAGDLIDIFRHTLETGEPYLAPSLTKQRQDVDVVESYEWQIHRVTLPDGQYGVVCYFFNATRLRQAEEKIKQQAEALTGESRRKDEFLAILAHELRGPLAPLANMLEVMKRAHGNAELIQQARSTMQRQVAQMTRLIDDLLDASRVSRDKLGLRREPIELASVVHHAVEACRPAMDAARHELTVTLPPQPMYLHADPVRLGQVFLNLLSNACKFTEPGGRISLTGEREGGEVVVSVKDTGVGIPPDMLHGIFDMFTQVDRSLERARGGLGIGLTLVRQLVEMHGGSVKAFSEGLARGSELVVRLPVLSERIEPPPEPAPSDAPALTGRRILVVDDNRDSAHSLSMLLEMTGNETRTAHDGFEAVEAAAAFRPDIVLLDIGLPKLNGYEAARRIREQPWGKNMLLVAVSGWGQEEDRQKSSDAGFDAHLVKPVNYAALTKLLAKSPPAPG